MFGFCFSKIDLVSGIIWPVISGFDTTATVTSPGALLAPLPPPEHAAPASTITTDPPTRPSVRSLNRDDLII